MKSGFMEKVKIHVYIEGISRMHIIKKSKKCIQKLPVKN